jgi:mono/diheme cytochrome c family protein
MSSRFTPGRRAALRALFTTLLLSGIALFAAEPSPADLAFFESKIRPLLAEHCYSCHSARAEKLKGALYADSREGLLKGGESGPAIVPGDPDKSLVIKAVRSTDADLQMPPKNQRLSGRQIADLTRWVKSGAPWPTPESAGASHPVKSAPEITEKDRSWWSFQPIRRPQRSESVNSRSVISKRSGQSTDSVNTDSLITGDSIDELIRAELAARGLKPNPPATKRELIRRAYFDLIGLPPTPEQMAAFEKDKSPAAWERLIEQLLSLPHYGERWGRHWLDVVRFAQSNGYERDGEKPEAWRYRDYVVKAFNEDKPYDRFVREQIAGDELEPVTFASIMATGFQRLGVWDDEPDDKRMAEFDELDDVLSTTGTAFLGLTIGCARCHEHKFDPIPQADYYSLLSFFRNIRLNEAPKYTLDSPNYVPLAAPAKVAEWGAAHEARLNSLQTNLAGAKDDAEKKKLTQQIEATRNERAPFEFALAVRERGPQPPPTHVLIRGNAGNPGAEVQPAFLSVLAGRQPTLRRSRREEAQTLPVSVDQSLLTSAATNQGSYASAAASTGRRRALADWVASAENPLTARVMANRIWQHHFGRGLVKTTSDFGHAGALPSHPALLDWLAAEFIESGWSIKKLHKTIMLSQTYQMSSRAENTRAMSVDPDNRWLWRQNLRRLEAEALRDTILAISGKLNLRMGGRGFFPHLSGEVLAGQSRPGLDWEISSAEELSRRSLYAYVRRTMSVPMLDAFDYSNTTSPLSERPVTTVAPQALLLLNDAFMQEQAAALAERLERGCGAKTETVRDWNRPHPGPLPQEREDAATSRKNSSVSGPSQSSENAVSLRSTIAQNAAGVSPSPGGAHFTRSQTDAFIQRGFQLAVGRDPTRHERQLAREFIRRQEQSLVALRTRLTFRPDVPTSLSVEYMNKLKPEQFLVGSQAGWTYHRGRWSGAYEGIRTMERDRGPFALATTPVFSNGMIEAKFILHTACESAGLMVCASTKDDELRGYEVVLEPREQRIVLRRHEAELLTLTRATADLPTARILPLKVQVTDARIRVWLGDDAKPLIDCNDSKPMLAGGRVGARSWGAALSIDDLVVRPEGAVPVAIRDPELAPPERRALQAFCLLLLNLNEVAYVD